jgi:signal transduction histidine kinase
VLFVLVAIVLPLGAISVWTIRSAQRSGRMLLRSQLDAGLEQTEQQVAAAWKSHRANLLTLGENESVRALLEQSGSADSVPSFVARAFSQMAAIDQVIIRDRTGRGRLSLVAPGLAASGTRAESAVSAFGVPVHLPVTDLMSGDTIGSLDAVIRLTSLVPSATLRPSPGSPLLAVTAPGANTLYPAGVDQRIFIDEQAEWNAEHFTTVQRRIAEPSITLMLAGALSPYEKPFELAARRNAVALLPTFAIIAVISVGYIRKLSREIERELAQREALAAVGEFASELAHEVRNPLTAMRLDLQRAEESVLEPDVLRAVLPRVIAQIARLDRAVSGALRVTRSGSMEPTSVDLRAVLESARQSAEPEFARRNARVIIATDEGLPMLPGDPGALEQLFLNLLVNAAQALGTGGHATVTAHRDNGSIVITVRDNGRGMTPAQVAEVQQPYRSTRRDGTGLGLKVARRIALSHRGEITLESKPGEGTSAVVRLPSRH